MNNVICLPYQPLKELAGSLSAADLQVVVMGEKFVGLVHPCKIYNVLSVGVPVLYIGPPASHVSEILDATVSEQLRHGDVDGVVNAIKRIKNSAAKRPVALGPESPFAQKTLLPKLVAAMKAN